MDGRVIGKGRGRTKKAAEQQAAYQAILELRKTNVFKEHRNTRV